MVAQGPDLPIHLGSMPDAVRAVIQAFGNDIHDGDVFIHNDPYFGGSHLPDVNVVGPAFYEGRVSGLAACVLIGRISAAPLRAATAVTEVYGEGLRLPPVRIYDKGELDRNVEAIIRANVRTPDERWGDLSAHCLQPTGEPAIVDLAAKYGGERLTEIMRKSSTTRSA